MNNSKNHRNKSKYHYGSNNISVWWEYLMSLLVFVNLIMLLIDFFGDPNSAQIKIIRIVDLTVASILLTEFFTRLMLSTHKKLYLHHNWWYLFAAIPLSSPLAEALRGIRLIGLIRLFRLGSHVIYEKRL